MSQGLPEENGPDSSAVLQTDGVLFQWQAQRLGSQTRLTNSILVRGERFKELCLQVLVFSPTMLHSSGTDCFAVN